MIILLSPAKKFTTQDFRLPTGIITSVPPFLEQATVIEKKLARFSVEDWQKSMRLSAALASTAKGYFDGRATAVQRPALFAFAGDVYRALDAFSLSEGALHNAQSNLFILSGFYGMLRAFDAIAPYRLEMGADVPLPQAARLHDFWKERTSAYLFGLRAQHDFVVNLASAEYAKAIKLEAIGLPVISPRFLRQKKDGEPYASMLYGKRARGTMCRWLLTNAPESVEDIDAFADDGYAHDAQRSTPQRPVFIQPVEKGTSA